MADRVLILGTAQSFRLQAFLEAAERLGVQPIRALDVPPAHMARGDDFLGLDFRDVDRSIELAQDYARQHRLKAIVATDDATVTLAAHLAEALDLPHNAIEAAEASRDKHLMRQRFAEAGVPSPWFRLFSTADDPAQILPQIHFPCVLKPTRLSGSRGVIRADGPGAFRTAFARLKNILEAAGLSQVLVEGYLPGQEVALEGLLSHGQLKVLALFDKPDPLEGPFFEETIYVTPSRLPAEAQAAAAACAERAARALGLREGPVHAELRINAEGPWVIEVAGRSIGGLCSQALRFNDLVGDFAGDVAGAGDAGSGLTLEELILRQALGLEIKDWERERRAGGVMMIPIPAAGTLAGVSGLDSARAVPGIESIQITARINYPVVPLPEGDSYSGFIFARGETPAEVEAALREAHRRLIFDIVPELPLA